MIEFPLLRESLRDGLKRAGEDLAMLMGGELVAEIAGYSVQQRQEYLAGVDGAILVVKIDVRGDCEGAIYCVQDLRDAIVFSSTLLGIPEARIREKRTLSIFSDDDVDAYGEIGNQIAGSFNMVFEKGVAVKAHLKSSGVISFTQDEAGDGVPCPFEEGGYLVCRGNLQPGAIDTERFDVLVPLPLATAIDPSVEEVPVPEPVAVAASVPLLLVSSHETADTLVPAFSGGGFDVTHIALGADLDLSALSQGACLAVLATERPDEQAMALCLKFSGFPAVKLVALSDGWTRGDVLRAMRYGVRDILLPAPGEQIIERLRRHV